MLSSPQHTLAEKLSPTEFLQNAARGSAARTGALAKISATSDSVSSDFNDYCLPPGGQPDQQSKVVAIQQPEAIRTQDLLQPDRPKVSASSDYTSLHLPSSFAGPLITNQTVMDCQLAAGPFHLLAISTTNWAVLSKAGEVLLECDWQHWYASLFQTRIAGWRFAQSKALYDQHSGRWILLTNVWRQSSSFDGYESAIWLAVSQTRNPLGAWWGWQLDLNLNGAQRTDFHASSVGIGVDNLAVYVTADLYDRAGKFQYAKLRILKKSECIQGETIHWTDIWDLRNADETPVFSLCPSHTFGTPGVQYLINPTSAGNAISVWSLKYAVGTEPLLQRRTITTETYSIAPDASQPAASHSLATGDTRFVNAVFRNGTLWAAHTIAANWGESENHAAIQWWQLNPAAGRIIQHHVFGAAGLDYFSPAIMADGRGNFVIVFNRSGANEYPSIRLTGRRAIDTRNKLHASFSLRSAAQQVAQTSRFGTGAALDPNDIKLWVVGALPAQDNQGMTWIGETSFMSNQPEQPQK